MTARSGTQLALARSGRVSAQMRRVAEREGLAPETVRDEVARGRMIIPANVHHTALDPMAIGLRASVKVNADVDGGATPASLDEVLDDLALAQCWGADAVMDRSTGPRIDATREALIANATVPVGSVPVHQAVASVGHPEELTAEQLLAVIEHQARQGVDYMTIHAGVRLAHLSLCQRRVTGIVSRGGGMLARWMVHHLRENPLYEHFDDILEICRAHDVAISLGDGLRPGSIADASDAAQFAELDTLGELTQRARGRDVQVMVEGAGHVPLDQLEANVRRQQDICRQAPSCTLGPLVTDVALGYDYITSAIGAAIAAWHGTSMVSYVAPREHPGGRSGADAVKQGLIAYKIAAHAADLARGSARAATWDRELSQARFASDRKRQRELALDPDAARDMRGDAGSSEHFTDIEWSKLRALAAQRRRR